MLSRSRAVSLPALTPQLTPAPAVLAGRVQTGELGGVILVAGHGDTIPEILTALGVTAPPPITEAEFDNLYVGSRVRGGGAGSIAPALRRAVGNRTSIGEAVAFNGCGVRVA